MEIAINYWAVLGASVAAFVIGGLWYGPVFGKQWMGMMGFSHEGMKTMQLSPMAAMGVMFILGLLLNYVLAHVAVFAFAYLGTSGISGGLSTGFWMWLGFAVPFTAGHFLWENKSWKLWAFNASYYLVTFLLAGAILGAFPA